MSKCILFSVTIYAALEIIKRQLQIFLKSPWHLFHSSVWWIPTQAHFILLNDVLIRWYKATTTAMQKSGGGHAKTHESYDSKLGLFHQILINELFLSWNISIVLCKHYALVFIALFVVWNIDFSFVILTICLESVLEVI